MTEITFDPTRHKFSNDTKTISISEKDVTFDTAYTVMNPKTGNSKRFDFTHSTGSEFDPNTKWIYKADNGVTLEVCNDAVITEIRAKEYLKHKLKHS